MGARLMTIEARYHVAADFPVVVSVDGRSGQLPSGALADADEELDLGSLLNTLHLKKGDQLFFISSDDELTRNVEAEKVVNNVGAFVIVSVADPIVTFEETFNAEPNSTPSKFFEFKVLRPSPYRKFTFRRQDQTAFVPDFLAVNGEIVVPTLSGFGVLPVTVQGDFGQLTFTPIGSSRWSCEMAIVVDGVVELGLDADVVITPTTAPEEQADVALGPIEIRMSNINILQDAPLEFFRPDPRRFGSYVAAGIGTGLRLLGDRWLNLQPSGTDLELLALEPNLSKIIAGTTNDFLMTVKDRKTGFVPNLEGSVFFMEIRAARDQSLLVYKEVEWISTGLVRGLLSSGESQAGIYYLSLEVHRGGVPAKVQRTNGVMVRILAS